MPIDWPQLPNVDANDPQAEVKKTLLQGQLELRKLERQYELEMTKLERQAEIEEERAIWDNEYKLLQAAHNAYFEVAKGQVDRVAASAELVLKAASAIATIYTSVLGLSFVVNQQVTNVLPGRGLVPAMFLGLSIVLAIAFRAYITKPDPIQEPAADELIPVRQRKRRNTFILWARRGAMTHRYWLQTAVISLGVGVALLPMPYLHLSYWMNPLVVLGGLALTFGVPWLLSRGANPLGG